MGCLYKRTQKHCSVCGRLARAGCRTAGHVIEVRELPTIWIKFYQNGRPIRETTGTTKESVARRMLRAREGDVERGIPIDPKMGKITFEEAAEALIEDYAVNRKKTREHVERYLKKHLTPIFKGKRLINITPADVRSYMVARQTEGAANATINRELSALKRMFTLAVRDGKLHAKPHIPMLAERNARQGFFEREAFASVRDHLPAALQPVAIVAYWTGWRTKSEILPMQWHQIDREQKLLRLEPNTTKNCEGREFAYGDIKELKATIDSLWAEHERLQKAHDRLLPDVFIRTTGKRAGKRIKSWRRAWLTACRNSGVPGRIPHDFRRTAVRNAVRAGISEQIAMKMSGHKTRSVFDRYDIVSQQDLRDAGRKLGQAVAGTLSGTVTLTTETSAKQSA